MFSCLFLWFPPYYDVVDYNLTTVEVTANLYEPVLNTSFSNSTYLIFKYNSFLCNFRIITLVLENLNCCIVVERLAAVQLRDRLLISRQVKSSEDCNRKTECTVWWCGVGNRYDWDTATLMKRKGKEPWIGNSTCSYFTCLCSTHGSIQIQHVVRSSIFRMLRLCFFETR